MERTMAAEMKPAKQKSQSQRERFIETARKLEADESGEAFDKAFGKIVPPKSPKVLFGKPAETKK